MRKKTDKTHEFINIQNTIIDNLGALRINLLECTNAGMQDEEDGLYNEIVSLEDDAKTAANTSDLAEVISEAKVIENKLDSWYSSFGVSTLELDWPEI